MNRLKLNPGVDLKLSIAEFARKNNINGFIVGVVGDLSKAVVQCPKNKTKTSFDGTLEIISLNGTISPESVHLHLAISDGDCRVWGGHLEQGAIVLKGADILINSQESKLTTTNLTSFVLEVATLPNCPWSNNIKKILSTNKIPHKIININSDANFESIKKRSGSSTFPQIFLDGVFRGGYDDFLELYQKGDLYK
ncbi:MULTISPECIES: PCC domain-containing protein [Prochlorococcus]|uniref:Protein containing glutaredoxin domain and PD1-like DNA-binding domain n=1 Tax=Prochlorococcus marinus (strain SARG / CCMP1375 / SS120) TaxID=167539 RepID=Q7VC67_PROMA|nr:MULTISPECIES: DUF296 domain-containing protein [Prochlorococcus]AAP99919.1 Protein containing glutaredoxin domain and PD1-like DNA-binding domain [Prochlorococcus marinus subsp. marinus str. CCMP1375]KGG11733.1 hypothetical protein EV04_0758 [Prochlorococcus marinus str. LG]KGG18853.1 hypothetical protein EV08_1339 [Prochlorococcus marinus str. SS2]KGG23609.1 hypothetical protein EV09_1234 [Prochlorococcus marinus str. SS35]KGG32155.1 hypothetical protein EV10_1269 [Prochlorococcus marinus 